MAKVAMTLSVPDQTGAARMLFYFARSMTERGHEVTVLHGPPPDVTEHGSILDELRECGVATTLVPVLARPVPPFARLITARAAAGSDVVIGVNQRDRAVAIGVADALGVPAVLSVQNQHNFWGPLVVPRLKRWYYGRALRTSSVLCICTSDVVRQEVVEMGVPPERCPVLHNGIDVARYSADPTARARARAELGLGDDDRMFVNVGRLDVQKGQDLLLRAWELAEPPEGARLVLVGDVTDGSQQARSARFKQELVAARAASARPDSIVLLGWRNDVKALLSAADVYVHSARWEGWPLTVVEAMAASRPFIMTDCSGLPNGFEEGRQGLVVETGNVEALAGAIRHFAELPPDALGEAGQASFQLAARHYDLSVVCGRFTSLVEQTLGGVSPAP